MGVFECERMAQEYAEWLRQEIKAEAANGVCTLTVPFLDRHRDYLQLYVTPTDSGVEFSDDGYVIRDLRISGIELDTERRKEALNHILRSFNVALEGDELKVESSGNNIAQKKHDIIQAMLAIGDLVHLAAPTVTALFKEDVERYLRSKEIIMVGDVKLTGGSGLEHLFDFVIGGSNTKPERYIRAIGTPSRNNFVELMFSWQDLRGVRPSSASAYAILNDQERELNPSLVDALKKYDIGVIPWSERDANIATFL